MRQIIITLFLITRFYSSIAQESLLRTIDWSTKDIENHNFLWFENAIYPDPSTMAPSYFELIGLDELGVVDVNNLNVYSENGNSERVGQSKKSPI